MKLFSPRLWSIAWRVRLGLLVVPCLLMLLAWYQFRVSADTVEQYRDIVADTDTLLIGSTQMMQHAEAMENYARGLHLWMQNNSAGATASADEAHKSFVVPYRDAKISFEKTYQQTVALAPANSPIEKRLNDFYDSGLEWQREIAEPMISALHNPKPLDAGLPWRPFDEAETTFSATRDELMMYRRSALSGADRFRWFSTLSVLAMESAAIILAIWIGVSLARAVTSPLGSMVAHSRRIEAGNYAQSPVMSSDEFGEVTGAMNAMATSMGARLERERLAGRITAAVSRSLDAAAVLETTACELGQALHASRCVLCLPREAEDGGPLFYQWTASGIAPHSDELCTPHALPPAWQRVLKNKEVLAVTDCETWDDAQSESLHKLGTRSLLAAPLLLRDKTAGIIALEQCMATREWQPLEVELLEFVAAQVAVALDNARLLRESEQRTAELRQAHDALEARGVQLYEKNRELEQFVYTVSHDLKAPLISIQGYLEALHEDFGDKLPPDAKPYLERVNANARQLESLIGDLIELSRIGRVREQWETADTRQLAREAAAELALQAQSKVVQIEIAPDLPSVRCEKKRVRQVFLNLLDNAIKYSDPAKPSRWVKVACEETPTHWQFSVSDNGLGIAGEHLEKAFGIFQRVGSGEAPGSGIGLSIVRRTAQAHGGRAWSVSAGSGQGTTFYFTLSKKPDVPDSE